MAPCIQPASNCPSYAVGCQTNPFTGAAYDSCCVSNTGLLVFAQNYTTGLSYKVNSTWTKNAVVAEIGNRFTVHGLWADNCDGSYNGTKYVNGVKTGIDYDLIGCDASRAFENAADVIKANPTYQWLADWMNVNWRAGDGDNSWFWSHEWSKHGTCTSSFEPKCYGADFKKNDDFFDFMTVSIQVYKSLDLLSAFKASGIVPSDSVAYKLSDLNAAHKAAFGFEGGMQCVVRSGNQYLNEVWTYMNEVPGHNFQVIAPVAGAYQSCKNTTAIYIPVTPFKTAQ
ncbi:ribonuclease T2-like protein [Chytriomyces sp. MP71]|nr:ribonuclease T2-like protein [Chytriomyces sp. MP71]